MFSKMKFIYIYILIFLLSISCKVDKKNSVNDIVFEENKTIVIDTLSKELIPNEKKSKIAINDLIGKTLRDYELVTDFAKYSEGGAIIEESFKGRKYSLSEFQGKNDVAKFIVFVENLEFKNSGRKFRIVDVLDLTGKEYFFLKDVDKNLYIHFCYKDGINDQEIIAIAEYEENVEFFTKIYKAWRADRRTEKIVEIPIDGIKVENVGF